MKTEISKQKEMGKTKTMWNFQNVGIDIHINFYVNASDDMYVC